MRHVKNVFAALVMAVMLSGCIEGPVGPQGDQGSQGDTGAQGIQGIGVEDKVFVIIPQSDSDWEYEEYNDGSGGVATIISFKLTDVNDNVVGTVGIHLYETSYSSPNVVYNIELHDDWFESECGYIVMHSVLRDDNWSVRKDMKVDIDNGVCSCIFYDLIWATLSEFERDYGFGDIVVRDFELRFYKIKPA